MRPGTKGFVVLRRGIPERSLVGPCSQYLVLAFSEGGAFWFDSMRSQLRGADPDEFLEWSEAIEKKSKEDCNDLAGARITFRGAIDEERRFSLDVDAVDSDAILCLLKAIQSCLDLMPSAPKRFYATLMEALATQAEERAGIDGPWHF